jgi:AcrR family transcriptional regulator
MARRLSRVRFQVCIRQGVAPIFARTSSTEVFRKSEVDAAVREIAERAGVGLGTVYRHFPQRSDLIVAVFQTQVDACADAASVIASKYEPGDALARWMQRYVDFILRARTCGSATLRHRSAGLLQRTPAASTENFAGCGRCSESSAPRY